MVKALRIIATLIALTITQVNADATAPKETKISADDISVSLVTFYPGEEIYELEGHSALRIQTPTKDVAVSYGDFDFNAPNFVYRFVKGETDYGVALINWQFMERAYRSEGRRIVERQIDLNAAQKERLMSILDVNLQPQNRTYRYNYVRDNCATRPLAIIEKALGDSIILGSPGEPIASLTTWRQVMEHYHRNYPWYQFGIDLALGVGIDQEIDNRRKAFAPAVLDLQLAGATAGGKALVSKTIVHNDTSEDKAILAPTPWYVTPLCVSIIILIITLAISALERRKRCHFRAFDSLWFGIEFMASLLLWFLVFISEHEATSPNYLAIWLNPTLGVLAVAVWIKACKKLVNRLKIANFALLIVALTLCLTLGQRINAALWPLAAVQALRCLPAVTDHKCKPTMRQNNTPRNTKR